ncbi:hypothetical protein GCM10028808_75270 [Spirosoma migulaei]
MINRYENFSTIDTLAFPGKPLPFDDIYEPLYLISANDNKLPNSTKMDNHLNIYSFLSRHTRIIIEDFAGMGKSTLVKKIFRLYIQKQISIPILIELRHININNSIIDEIVSQIYRSKSELNENFIYDFLKAESFLIIFDGYDEISTADRVFTSKDLRNFLRDYPQNYYILTSRVESSLVSVGNFTKFHIKPLVEQEAYNLLYRYDKFSLNRIADRLIGKIKYDSDPSILEYLENPLLVSLLYKAFEYKKEIPLKKTLFYRQIFEALFESHDEKKMEYFKREKYSNLHIDDFERVLRYVGYFTAIQNKVEYDFDYLFSKIQKAKTKASDLNFKSSDFITDLLHTVPLFKREGVNIKWAHKSLQDYFAAKCIWLDSKKDQEAILSKIFHDPNSDQFDNILELFYEFEPLAYESTILYWQLINFKEFADNHINLFKYIPIEIRKSRIEKAFHTSTFLIVESIKGFKNFKKNKDIKVLTNDYNELKKIGVNDLNTEMTFVEFRRPRVIVIIFRLKKSRHYSAINVTAKLFPTLVNFEKNPIKLTPLKILEKSKIYMVDFSEENPLNNPLIFKSINQYIAKIGNISFIYNEAMKKLQEIESRRIENTNNDFLDWNT